MTNLFERILLPVADPADAKATCDALARHEVGQVVAIHVIEKAGGAPDKASVEQRKGFAQEIFDVVAERLANSVPVETRIAYGTDVAETIFDVADEADATAIVVTPREGSRWIRLLTGDVALSLVTKNDRPVVVLPDVDAEPTDEEPTSETDGG
jgi:nucleotide-binding universal stress UspA family protein